MATVDNAGQYICGTCKTPVQQGDLTCSKCRANLITPGGKILLDSTPDDGAAVAPPPPDDKIICPDCGRPSDEMADICVGCGHALGVAILEFRLGGEKIRVLVTDKSLGIGRDTDWAPRVAHHLEHEGEVSAIHARVIWADPMLFVEDRDSLNGTYVNGRKLTPGMPTVLSDGDTIDFSPKVRSKLRMRK